MGSLIDTIDKLLGEISDRMDFPVEPRAWLEFLGKRVGCEWATYWKVNHRTHLLFPAATWNTEPTKAQGLQQQTGHLSLAMSEGNAGLVWRNQKPIWTTDLTNEICSPRSITAQAAVQSAGVWFALKTDQKIFGVIELLGRSLPQRTPELLAAVEKLGLQIGNRLAHPHGDIAKGRKPL
jgi:hypothetical protein